MMKDLCGKCQQAINKMKQGQKQGHVPDISAGFLNQLALQLRFSFQAIALLVDCAVAKAASLFQFRIKKIEIGHQLESIEQAYDENYLEIIFDTCLTNQEFIRFSEGQIENNQLNMFLKIGILGLGKTGVIVCNDGKKLKVTVFSVDDRVNSTFYKNTKSLYYIEDIKTKQTVNYAHRISKVRIGQIFKLLKINDEFLEIEEGTTKINIFHPRIYVMSNKMMVYQISESNFGHDVDFYHNVDKLQLLNKIGYEITSHAEFRLSSYFSLLYLHPPIKFKISEKDQPLQYTTYLDYIRLLDKNGLVTKLPEQKIYNIAFMEIYEAKSKYFPNNNGILLYSGGRMITRQYVEFGTLMSQIFYNTKYSKPARNMFKYLGVIDLNPQILTPNIVRNKFISNIFFFKFNKDIRSYLQKIEKKNAIIFIEDLEDNKNVKQLSEQVEEIEGKKKVKVDPQ